MSDPRNPRRLVGRLVVTFSVPPAEGPPAGQ